MRIGVLKVITISIFAFFVFFTGNAYAQLSGTDVTLSINPENPTPGQEVSATLTSYVFDLNKSNVTWSVNGQMTSIGIGKNKFSFRVGALGTQTTLEVSIETADGQTIRKNIALTTTDIDMLWEAADSYRPPFYKGKTLVGKEGSFKVVAVPSINVQNQTIDPDNLSYVWQKNDEGAPNASGWGKTFFTFKNSYLDPTDEIKVKVTDLTGKINTEGVVRLQGVDPKIVFYRNDPVLGINFNKAIPNGFTLKKEGETIMGLPYFFSPKKLNSNNVDIKWTLGERELNTNNPKNEISVKPEEGKTGSAKIKMFITNKKTLFQETEKEINVNF